MHKTLPIATAVALALCLGAAHAQPAPEAPGHDPETMPSKRPKLDHSGERKTGIASFYASKYFGRPMADGKPMRPEGNNAASKTLPLGTLARVINLETGRSTVVKIQDRGPFIRGRIIDLSPASAKAIGLSVRQGLARVAVLPIAVPQPDGSVAAGAGAAPELRADANESR